MTSEASPEDEKYLESLRNLLKISEEHEKLKAKDASVNSEDVKTEESEDVVVVIPPEQRLEPAPRVEPLKSMVEPEYVRKVIKQLDTMSTEQLKQALIRIKVSTGGNKKTLRKRVAQYYRKENALLNRKQDPTTDKTYRNFDYLIATDFECTCVEVIYDYPHEIIELPAVLIDVREQRIVSEFRTYVRPVRNPVLSDFCVEFTKIAQETVDEAPYFREALEKLYQWMRKFGLGEKNVRFAFVTDGPHDMWKFMQFQCLLSNIKMPHMFRNFINVKKTFKEKFNGLVKGNGKSGIENMLERLDLSFVGNKHSGLDDARNIAQIAIQMMKMKIELRINQKCSYTEPTRQSFKDNDEETIGDTIDLQSIDISRRDFQLWLRRLPLKLSSVTRREFLTEEYLDCESCDDLTDDKNDQQSLAEKMAIRAMIEQDHDREFEEIAKQKGYFKIGEVTPRPTPVSDGSDTTDISDEDSESDYEDYARECEMLDLIDLPSSKSTSEEVELNSVWQKSQSSSLPNNEFPVTTTTATSPSTLPTSSAVDVIMDSDSVEDMNLMAPPPKNSLASSSTRNNRHY